MRRLKVKLIFKGTKNILPNTPPVSWNHCDFYSDPTLQEYDWLVVYDEMPKNSYGTLVKGKEPLRCPKEHTLLVTAEPPTIKIYPPFFTRQFGAVLSTHSKKDLKHPHLIQTGGALFSLYDKALNELPVEHTIEKTEVLSAIHSAHKASHEKQEERMNLLLEIAREVPELHWFGRGEGLRPLGKKYEALDAYKYTIAQENYFAPHHWTEKAPDAFLGLCLPFYVGHPSLADYVPAESFISIPLSDPQKAAQIIKEAIANNEYEKRLPALKEARRLILEKYNFFALVSAYIEEHHNPELSFNPASCPRSIKGRHSLRLQPLNCLQEGRLKFKKILFKKTKKASFSV